MKRYLLILLVLLFPTYVFAYYDLENPNCTNSQKVELKTLASNVNYRLSKQLDGDKVTYNMIFYDVDDKIKIIYNDTQYDSVITGLNPGETITLYYYGSNDGECSKYKAMSKKISIPYYNKYYTNDICMGYEEYYLCQENSNVSLSELEFEKAMTNYINSEKNTKEEEPSITEYEKNIFEKIYEYIYIIYIVLALALLLLIIILIKKRKNNKEKIL